MKNNINIHSLVKNTGLNLLSEGKTIRMKAHGYSMYPNIKPGSLVLIEPIQLKGAPVPGEIIAVIRGNGLIIHRLVKTIKKNNITFYIARGDSNPYPDMPVGIESIAGRVTGAETTGENPQPADIRIKRKPGYFLNRLKVIGIIILKKLT